MSLWHLDPEAIHVWHASLHSSPACFVRFERLLSPEEQQRAARFRFDRDRARFVLARGMLRTILAEYTNVPPESLVFDYGPHGKPCVAAIPLNFNLSHSGDVAVYAVSSQSRLGIDIELVRPMAELDLLARRVFSRGEKEALAAIGPEDKAAQFFQLWTRKESVLKGVGLGLGTDLRTIEVLTDSVQLLPGANATDPLGGETSAWWVHNLLIHPQYKAAVATDRENVHILDRVWPRDRQGYLPHCSRYTERIP